MFWKTIRDRLTDELLARRVDRWIAGGIVVLLVVVGFLAGQWTSFTRTATPIVFQEAPGATSSAVTAETLKALVQDSGTGAGSEQSKTDTRPVGAFVASASGSKYYVPDCAEVRRIKEENRVWFGSAQEAEESGYEVSECVKKRGGGGP